MLYVTYRNLVAPSNISEGVRAIRREANAVSATGGSGLAAISPIRSDRARVRLSGPELLLDGPPLMREPRERAHGRRTREVREITVARALHDRTAHQRGASQNVTALRRRSAHRPGPTWLRPRGRPPGACFKKCRDSYSASLTHRVNGNMLASDSTLALLENGRPVFSRRVTF